jgi:hypothetical protein
MGHLNFPLKYPFWGCLASPETAEELEHNVIIRYKRRRVVILNNNVPLQGAGHYFIINKDGVSCQIRSSRKIPEQSKQLSNQQYLQRDRFSFEFYP